MWCDKSYVVLCLFISDCDQLICLFLVNTAWIYCQSAVKMLKN